MNKNKALYQLKADIKTTHFMIPGVWHLIRKPWQQHTDGQLCEAWGGGQEDATEKLWGLRQPCVTVGVSCTDAYSCLNSLNCTLKMGYCCGIYINCISIKKGHKKLNIDITYDPTNIHPSASVHTFKEVHNCFIQNIPKLETIKISASVKWLNKSLHIHTMAPDPAVRVSDYRQERASFTDGKLDERSQTYDNRAVVFRLDKGQQTSIPNRSVQSARLVIQ